MRSNYCRPGAVAARRSAPSGYVGFCAHRPKEQLHDILLATFNRSRGCAMADNTSNLELRRTWESAAPGWAKWEGVFSAGLSGVTDTLIDMAGIRLGMRVLDVACGAGSQSIQAAKR